MNRRFYPRAIYNGRRVCLTSLDKGWYNAQINLFMESRWFGIDPYTFPHDFFPQPGSCDRDECTGKMHVYSQNLIIDRTGRLSSELLAEPVHLDLQPALYKGHRVRASQCRPGYLGIHNHEPEIFIAYRVPEGCPVPETIDWINKPFKAKDGMFYGYAPISDEAMVKYDEGYSYKMACYHGFFALVKTMKDGVCAIEFAVPEMAQYENADLLIRDFKQESFDTFSGMVPISDPCLYIDDTEIIREDLLTHTFPVNWRAAEYKGCKIMVGAHSATHHFVTHHAGIFLPRGVIPAFLSSVTATQTGPQDFMAKIPIGDPDLIFTNPPQS